MALVLTELLSKAVAISATLSFQIAFKRITISTKDVSLTRHLRSLVLESMSAQFARVVSLMA